MMSLAVQLGKDFELSLFLRFRLAAVACSKHQTLHDMTSFLQDQQRILQNLNSSLSVPNRPFKDDELEVTSQLETEIDRLTAQMPPLREFLLPGGSEAAAYLHLSRAVCRRAERSFWEAAKDGEAGGVFLNRLSDYLFTAARYANFRQNISDITWRWKPNK